MSKARLTNARLLNRETLTSQFAKPKMTPEDFEEVILWLGSAPDGAAPPNRDRGVEKYEKIRQRIIRIYGTRGCSRADEIADKALDRFAVKTKKLRQRYKGDPALYVYAIAKRVHHEILREESQTITPPPPARDDPAEVELRHAWLEHCLKLLKPESRDLILRFYHGEKREKIENRKRLAEELGITSRALSLRALHIRQKLYDCVKGYLSGNFPPEVNPNI
jgi:DNA-directed RNA polymerase specialized sigma24 family protein